MRMLVEVDVPRMGVPAMLASCAWVRPCGGYRADPLRAVRGAEGVVFALALARTAVTCLPRLHLG